MTRTSFLSGATYTQRSEESGYYQQVETRSYASKHQHYNPAKHNTVLQASSKMASATGHTDRNSAAYAAYGQASQVKTDNGSPIVHEEVYFENDGGIMVPEERLYMNGERGFACGKAIVYDNGYEEFAFPDEYSGECGVVEGNSVLEAEFECDMGCRLPAA